MNIEWLTCVFEGIGKGDPVLRVLPSSQGNLRMWFATSIIDEADIRQIIMTSEEAIPIYIASTNHYMEYLPWINHMMSAIRSIVSEQFDIVYGKNLEYEKRLEDLKKDIRLWSMSVPKKETTQETCDIDVTSKFIPIVFEDDPNFSYDGIVVMKELDPDGTDSD